MADENLSQHVKNYQGVSLIINDISDIFRYYNWIIPVVPHKAVAEVSKIGNL